MKQQLTVTKLKIFVAFLSRALSETKRHYCSYDFEMVAVVRAIERYYQGARY